MEVCSGIIRIFVEELLIDVERTVDASMASYSWNNNAKICLIYVKT